jgi:hypothetical protein
VKRRVPEIVALLAVLYGVQLRLADLPGPLPSDVPDVALRLPAFVGGLAGLVAMYPASQRLVGRNAAAIATLAFALNPLHIFYSHFGGSVSLAVLGCIALVGLLRRVVDERPAGPAAHAMVAVTAGLLASVHPGALAVVVGSGLGAIALLFRHNRPRHTIHLLAAGYAAAAVVGVALALLAWAPGWVLPPGVAGSSFGPIDLGRWIFGSSAAAWVALLAVPAASVWMLRSGSDAAWLLVPAALLPIAVASTLAWGESPEAASNALSVTIPFLLMIVAWAIVAFADRVYSEARAATRLAISLGSALFLLAHIAGPFGIAQTDDDMIYYRAPRRAGA